MYADLKTVSSVALMLWVKAGIITTEEFIEANERNDLDGLVDLLNEKMDKLNFNLLREKVKECMID